MKRILCQLGVRLGLLETIPPQSPDVSHTIVIPAGTTWRGSLMCNHDVIVEGTVMGGITSPHGRVTVSAFGAVRQGAIRAAEVRWRGEISATRIDCKALHIEPTARNDRGLSATSATYSHLEIAMGVKVEMALRHASYDLAADNCTVLEPHQRAFNNETYAKAA